jgi:acetyltransferase-like isoleucine patch superfamily enzyme
MDCGKNCVVAEDVLVGENVSIGNNVIIYEGVVIGNNVSVGDNVILGKGPKLPKASTEHGNLENLSKLVIEDDISIGCNVIIFRDVIIGKNSFIADMAFIREKCTIAENVTIGKGVTVENNTSIGAFTKIQANAYITAYITIEDHVFIAPCVITTNDNFMGRTEERFKLKKGAHIKSGARVGGGVTLLPAITIGKEAMVAAGSVVTKDVPDYKLVMGIPARIKKDVPENEWAENQ